MPRSPRDAAAISFFALFTLVPGSLVFFALVDSFLGWMELHDRLLHQIVTLFPGSRSFLADSINPMADPSPPVLISCLFIVLWSSTWVFMFMENALNRAWKVRRRRTFWESRILSIALLVVGGILLITSAGITGFVSALRSRANASIPGLAGEPIINWLWSSVLLGAGFLVAVAVFFVIYKWMPDRRISWIEALSGAVVATFLWETASYIFAKMVPLFDYQLVYGRTGTLIVLMIWIYASSLILLFGANFSARLHQSEDERPPREGGGGAQAAAGGAPSRVHVFPRQH